MARRRVSAILGCLLCAACSRIMAAEDEDPAPAATTTRAAAISEGGGAPELAPLARLPLRVADAPPSAPSAALETRAPPASATAPVPDAPRCREQVAQEFLLRRAYLAKIGASAEERAAIFAARARATAYRTTEYGYFHGFGRREQNPHPPRYYARATRFMGLPLTLHQKVIPALACVEQALRTECADHPYQPRRVTGLRDQNTYVDYEVSSHVYGIALDIDPEKNPCCRCVAPWSESPLCKREVESVFERMAMPECWVRVFERHGFHWLGHDELEDTMHFEFLGDPARILEDAPLRVAQPAAGPAPGPPGPPGPPAPGEKDWSAR